MPLITFAYGVAMTWDERIGRRLKLQDLHTFLAVAECSSMGKAAARLALTQPAISRAIAEMEGTLGVRLFERTPRGVEVTPYGRAALKWSLTVFDDLKQAVGEIEGLRDPTSGEVRIGASEPMMIGLLPAVIDRFSRQNPRMTFQITHVPVNAREVCRVLHDRSVDLVIGRINAPVVEEDLECEVLFKEPLLAATGRQSRWAGRRKIALADLIDEPWTMAMPDTAGGALVVDAFRASGLTMPKKTVVCNSLHMQYALLGTGRYLGFVPGSLLRFAPERVSLQVLPIKLPIEPPPVGIVRLKNRVTRPAVQLFIEHVRHVAIPSGPR